MAELAVTLDSICCVSEDVVAREVAGEIVIVPLTGGIGDAQDELYSLNRTGHAIWKQLDGDRTLGQVAAALGDTFKTPLEEIQADVLGFADELVRRGILIVN